MSVVERAYKQNRNLFHYDRNDTCNVCGTNCVYDCCNKCGEAVCESVHCCSVFPHYKNTEYVVCRVCYETIDRKLKVVVDDDTQ
jgi:hypothetical protein